VTVDFATADSTATAGVDYVTTFGTLTFAPGEMSQTITVEVIDRLPRRTNGSPFTSAAPQPMRSS